jgi:hypothetical protein
MSQIALRATTLPLSSALGRTRTCDLLIRSLNTYVRECSLVKPQAKGCPVASIHRAAEKASVLGI